MIMLVNFFRLDTNVGAACVRPGYSGRAEVVSTSAIQVSLLTSVIVSLARLFRA
jgi:hypothetical protein